MRRDDTMRLFRGLKEPHQPSKVGAQGAPLTMTDFTDCPFTALMYARAPRGVVLVLDVPNDAGVSVSEEDWPNSHAQRLIVWGRFDHLIVAQLPAKELRAQIQCKGVAAANDADKALILRRYVAEKIAARDIAEERADEARIGVVTPHTRSVVEDWEQWSVNGEIRVEECVPAAPGSEKMTAYLTWLVREYASAARRAHKGCGTLPFVSDEAQRTPPTLAWALHMWFDLALMDRGLIEERVRQRGWARELPTGEWPAYWAERDGLRFVVDGSELRMDAAPGPVGSILPFRWASSLARVARARAAMRAWSAGGEGFVASMLVAVHDQVVPSRRPSRDLTLQHHRELVAETEPEARRQGLPITWHTVWRLPPGLKTTTGGEKPWLRFPAVSFVAAVHPFAAP